MKHLLITAVGAAAGYWLGNKQSANGGYIGAAAGALAGWYIAKKI